MSIGGSKGTGSTTVTQQSPYADLLAAYSTDILKGSSSLGSELTTTLSQILGSEGDLSFTDLDPTGAIETVKGEQAGTRKTTTEQLSRSGLLNTPWGQSILANQTMQDIEARKSLASEFETTSQQRKQELYQTALSLIPGFVSGMAGTGLAGLGGATAATTKQKSSGSSSGVSGGVSLK